MAEEKAPKNAYELVEALFEFVSVQEVDISAMPTERVLNELQEHGLDATPTIRYVNERIAKTKAQDRLRDAEMIRERIRQLVKTEKQRQSLPFEDLKRKILELIGPKPELSALYRNFEEVTKADLESMIEDLDLIDDIEKNGGF
jgi:hypothetical protein